MTERDSHEPSQTFDGLPDLMACPPVLRPQTPEAFEEWGARMRERARERHLARTEPQRALPLGDVAADAHAKLREAGFFDGQ